MSAFSIVINMMGVFLPRPEPTVSECLLQLEPQQRRPIVYGHIAAGYANESTMRNHKLFDSPVGINENVDYVAPQCHVEGLASVKSSDNR
ncbi:hypothetical protein C349_04719 [Cryptococcus neoformans var. grubii Br795]|nr:hypothetical protein C353_04692 [Cryptococcus neoformans var. grubii AD1-83a]OWZ52635.1 hypothetical protein C368_04865 [Cryptococcus neoformans var. grubii 125.91]OXG47729.1 hypothetical protein C355_04789 [Cryptococcus neoformans var. grubii Th84]OXG54728.1 hypothetical protein C354_04624 [Cryptococcus neoformans var. grubii MW-RSA1955]OXG58005.1 hypothetical protein C352_04609 [Cryptococcus neoformans var. grubii CHC193]OXG61042.1 hypothetical protein C351_04575 [Cryptococcus neoformans 